MIHGEIFVVTNSSVNLSHQFDFDVLILDDIRMVSDLLTHCFIFSLSEARCLTERASSHRSGPQNGHFDL